MPVTEAEIQGLMRECGVTLGPKIASSIIFVVESQGKKMLLTVSVSEDVIAQFRTFDMMTVGPRQYRDKVCAALMAANYEMKLVKFAFDHDDGEVVAYVDLFVGSGKLTKQQVQRCINTFRNSVAATWIRIEKIVETGEDPGGDMRVGELRGLLAELLAAAAEDESKKNGVPSTDSKKPKQTKGNFDDLLGDILDDK